MSAMQTTTKLAQAEEIYQIGGAKTGACQSVHTNHQVTISFGKVSPLHTQAHLCDTLTFINQDHLARSIAFGPHPEHQLYGGEYEVTVRARFAKTITLNQAGAYLFHDHLDPKITGNFTVLP